MFFCKKNCLDKMWWPVNGLCYYQDEMCTFLISKWLANSLLACISISEIQKSILNNLLHHGFFADI